MSTSLLSNGFCSNFKSSRLKIKVWDLHKSLRDEMVSTGKSIGITLKAKESLIQYTIKIFFHFEAINESTFFFIYNSDIIKSDG